MSHPAILSADPTGEAQCPLCGEQSAGCRCDPFRDSFPTASAVRQSIDAPTEWGTASNLLTLLPAVMCACGCGLPVADTSCSYRRGHNRPTIARRDAYNDAARFAYRYPGTGATVSSAGCR